MLSREELGERATFFEEEQMDEPLPEWASRLAEKGEMAIRQQAYTKDGSKAGNAIIMEFAYKFDNFLITVVTESGNLITNMNLNEFNELFIPGKYVMKGFPTTQSEKAWFSRHVS